MADGTFAVLWLVLGLSGYGADCAGEDCGATRRLILSGGEVLERRADAASELYVRYDPGAGNGGYDPAIGLSVGAGGAVWMGYGATLTFRIDGFYAELHFMPGLYIRGDGFDLGGPLAFRSGIEIGYEDPEGWRYGLAYDHRSNGGLFARNPGIETVQYRVAMPLD